MIKLQLLLGKSGAKTTLNKGVACFRSKLNRQVIKLLQPKPKQGSLLLVFGLSVT